GGHSGPDDRHFQGAPGGQDVSRGTSMVYHDIKSSVPPAVTTSGWRVAPAPAGTGSPSPAGASPDTLPQQGEPHGRCRGHGPGLDFRKLEDADPLCWGPAGRLRGPGTRASQRGPAGPGTAGGCAAALSPPAGPGLAGARPRRPAPVLHPDASGGGPPPGASSEPARSDPVGSRPRAHRRLDAPA